MAFDFHSLLASDKAKDTPPSDTANWALSKLNDLEGKVLDLACGNGRDSIYLYNQGLDILAVDVDAQAIDRIKKQSNMNCQVADALNLPFEDEVFSAIYSFGLLHVFTENYQELRIKALKESYRVLKYGAKAIFTTLWTDTTGMGLPELCCVTEAELNAALESTDYKVLSKEVVNDHSLTGWKGIYWRVLLAKER